MAQFEDINLTCCDCGEHFIFTAGEQRYFEERGLSAPKRCKACRQQRRKDAETKLLEDVLREFHVVNMKDIPSDPEHTLFIIGNGFDLMHGVKSSYKNFRDSMGKHSDLRIALERYLKADDLWANFEEALGHLDVSSMYDLRAAEMWFDLFDAFSPDAKASDFFMASETLMSPALQITQKLQRRFRSWVESLSVQTDKLPLAGLISDGKVLCFNYTEFIESLYGVAHKNVCYIHGCRKNRKQKLILGHAPVIEYEGENIPQDLSRYRSERKRAMVDISYDVMADHLNQYDEETTKDCGKIIHQHRKFFDGLHSVQQIVVIGHSLSPVDWDYFCEVNEMCPNARWYVSYYGVNDLKNCRTLMEILNTTDFSVFRTL